VADNLFEATLDLLWRQWRSIGGAAAGEPVSKQVDPEALCLASLFFRDHEPRLWTAMADWIRFGASLLSVQRLKNLATQFPDMSDQVKALGLVAWHEGKDARWKSLVGARGQSRGAYRTSSKQRSAGPALSAPPAFVLRLRAGFNVGVKADLLAFLLGQKFRVSVATAAASLAYGVPAIFRALQDSRNAGFVRSADLPSAAEYWVDIPTWYEVMGGEQAIPRWGFWREILVYACAMFTLEHERNYPKSSEYARATALRELAMQHEAGLVRSGMIEQAIPRSASFDEWREFHNALAQRIADLA
jgi:hypothetical protein